jgi:hypothetical protein
MDGMTIDAGAQVRDLLTLLNNSAEGGIAN